MRHRIEHKHAFGPRELRNLGRAFEGAWHELRAQGFEANTLEQIEMTRAKLARWIIDYAAIGERNVARLQEDGLMGLRWSAEFCAEDVPQFALGEKSTRGEEKSKLLTGAVVAKTAEAWRLERYALLTQPK